MNVRRSVILKCSYRVMHYVILNVILYAFYEWNEAKRQLNTIRFVKRMQNDVWDASWCVTPNHELNSVIKQHFKGTHYNCTNPFGTLSKSMHVCVELHTNTAMKRRETAETKRTKAEGIYRCPVCQRVVCAESFSENLVGGKLTARLRFVAGTRPA